MFYYLFEYLEKNYQLAGASLFQYLSFRSAITFILALVISTIFGKKIINFLKSKQIDENIRKLDLPGESAKKGTPTFKICNNWGSINLPEVANKKITPSTIIAIIILL